jgi:hypothetical protein
MRFRVSVQNRVCMLQRPSQRSAIVPRHTVRTPLSSAPPAPLGPAGDMTATRRPLILFYTPFFGSLPDIDRLRCDKGAFTLDRRRLAEADAVVFHLPDAHAMWDASKHSGQHWVGWSMESRTNTPVRGDPAAMRHFDLIMSFERSADVWCPYLPNLGEWQAALAAPVPPKVAGSPVAMFQSGSNDRSARNAFAISLMQHIAVDSYGRFLNNRQVPQPDLGAATKLAVIGGYRFCLGLENTFEDDYVTEKFFQPLLAGTVPVYRGAANVEDYAPGEHCYIDANRFRSAAELAAYLRHLAEDPAAYAAYFEWRTKPLRPAFLDLLRRAETEPFCRLAALLAERGPSPGRKARWPFGWRRALRTSLWRMRRAALR